MRTFTVVLSPDLETPHYTVSIPAAPGAATQGVDRDDALRNAVEAMELWLEVTLEQGGDALEETPQLIAEEIKFVLGWKKEEGWPLLVETATIYVAVPALVA
jgi:predicted RNase H-like HicB family nuclease